MIKVWEGHNGSHIDDLAGHRDRVSCLAFRRATTQLFSGSADRTVKVWNVEARAFIETLHGHQSEVLGIDCLDKERAVSSGADGTCRVWKIAEESQLVFKPRPAASIDCLSLVNESSFVTGSQDGSFDLWMSAKKSPMDVHRSAHGDSWVSAVSSCKRSDLAASGGHNGVIQLWSITLRGTAQAEPVTGINPINAPGFVNGLAFSKDGKVLIAGLGQEHRLGRWGKDKQAQNGVLIVPLQYNN